MMHRFQIPFKKCYVFSLLCDQNIGFSDSFSADTNTFSLLDLQQQKDSVSGHHLNEKYQEKTYSLRNEIKASDSSLSSLSVVQDRKEIPDVTPVSRKSFFFTDNRYVYILQYIVFAHIRIAYFSNTYFYFKIVNLGHRN